MSQKSLDEKKEKARWARIKRVYGIEKEQYDELDQGYCPICLRDWSANVRPCVDHDHVSGEVRGLLCIWCNRRHVGRFRDPDVVYRIYKYLTVKPRGWIVPKKKRRRVRRKGKK